MDSTLLDDLTSFIVIDLEAAITAGVELMMMDADRKDFIASVASGTPASEAYATIWRRRRR